MTKFEEEFKGICEKVKDKFPDTEFYALPNVEAVLEKFKDWHSDEQYQTAKRMVEHVQVENEMLKAKLKSQQQALPVVPKDVAKLPPFDDMKEYVLDERLLTIREYLNKLDDKSNNDITEAEAWCLTHEHIVYRAMLDGYTVEKNAAVLFEAH